MRAFYFLILLVSSLVLHGQKNPLEGYLDTLVFARKPIHISEKHQTKDTSYQKCCSNHCSIYRSIYLPNNYPIQRQDDELEKFPLTRIDTHIIKIFKGEIIHPISPDEFTFINPGNSLEDAESWTLSPAAAYYQNPVDIRLNFNKLCLESNELTTKKLDDFLLPFFFQNNEVTNMQYMTFVKYVKDSIARRILADELDPNIWTIPTYDSLGNRMNAEHSLLNWEPVLDYGKYDDNLQFPYLSSMFLNERDRFYGILEIDTRELVYQYIDSKKDTIKIKIYPDTLCWLRDFSDHDTEKNTNLYFWHPAYASHPVVGINWHQAKAYCNWLTEQTNKELKKKGFNYSITYHLPSMVQWGFVRTKILGLDNTIALPKFNWETNLILNDSMSYPLQDATTFTKDENMILRKSLLNGPLSEYLFTSSESHRTPKDDSPSKFFHVLHPNRRSQPQLKDTHFNSIKNINQMGNSLSEWMQESYQANWRLIYYKRMELLIKAPGIDASIQALKEDYFNSFNDLNGKMIIGANWYDIRDLSGKGNSFEAMDSKVFIDPNKSFCTVGFRLIGEIKFDE